MSTLDPLEVVSSSYISYISCSTSSWLLLLSSPGTLLIKLASAAKAPESFAKVLELLIETSRKTVPLDCCPRSCPVPSVLVTRLLVFTPAKLFYHTGCYVYIYIYILVIHPQVLYLQMLLIDVAAGAKVVWTGLALCQGCQKGIACCAKNAVVCWDDCQINVPDVGLTI